MNASLCSTWITVGGLIISAAALAQDGKNVRRECSSGHTAAETTACLEQKVESTNAMVRIAELRARSQVASQTREENSNREEIATLDWSMSEFLRFRTSRCAMVARLAMGRDAARNVRLGCVVELNLDRVEQLNAIHPSHTSGD
jgi:uridine phosphorylase